MNDRPPKPELPAPARGLAWDLPPSWAELEDRAALRHDHLDAELAALPPGPSPLRAALERQRDRAEAVAKRDVSAWKTAEEARYRARHR